MNKIKIMFVCTGNICRSPSAHGIFRDLIKKEKLEQMFIVKSSGTHSHTWHKGDKADPRSVATAKLFDCNISDLYSEQLAEHHFDYFDYIVVMDEKNINNIKQLFPNKKLSNVTKMLSYAKTIDTYDVPDPYYNDNFEQVFMMIDTACNDFLTFLKQKHKL